MSRKTPKRRKYRAEPPAALKAAVKALGGQMATARALTEATGRDPEENPIRQGHVWAWLRRSRFPPTLAPVMERLCAALRTAEHPNGLKITREQLCPEFPWHELQREAA